MIGDESLSPDIEDLENFENENTSYGSKNDALESQDTVECSSNEGDLDPSSKPKRRFNAKRLLTQLLSALIVIIGVTFVSFALAYISPTDPATQYFSSRGVAPTEAQLAQVRVEMGLDKPFLQQYIDWMGGLLHGDMGESYRSGRSVFESLTSALPYTLALALSVMALTLVIAIPAGLWSAYRKDSIFDRCVRAISYAFCSLPSFFVALVLLYVLSVQLHLLPVTSRGAIGIIMPTLAIALPLSAWFVRQVRTIGLEQLNAGYVDGLRARHISEQKILFKHVLRNSLVPILALVGISMGTLLGGSAIVESIFSWPGVGNLSISAISMRDYTVVQGYALLMAIVYLLINWGVEAICRFVDPRIREGRGQR